jgi:glucosylceramidase
MKLMKKPNSGKISHLFFTLIMLIAFGCKQPVQTEITIYSSSGEGDRLEKTSGKFSKEKDNPSVIRVNEKTRYQKIDGFGATFNEAGMICLNSLPAEKKEKVLKDLFDPENGSGFNLMKSPIAACDFASAGPFYSYDDTKGDTMMKNFTIERDLAPDGLITFIKAASKYGKFEIESPMDFAPTWMYYSLKPDQKHIKPEYYRALARYYSKYIQAYAANGITIGYLNLFNEADNRWYSNVTYKVMGEMIKNYIVPQFRADGITTKIQVGESANRPEAIKKFPAALDDPEVRKLVHSMTIHGYDWNKFSTVTELHEKYPELPIWMTEVCYVTKSHFPPGGPEKSPVFEFSDGERWGNMIVNDMKNWVSAWVYWNMILDQNGGPWLVAPDYGNPDPNEQHPVIIINRDTKEVTYTGLYWYLTHFSKFVKPGAYRIDCTGGPEQLNFAGFQNSDGSMVVNIINNGDAIECPLTWNGKMTTLKFKPHSITTVMWKI